MQAVQQQVAAVVEELNLLKGEIVGIKSQHANLHQSNVESTTEAARRFASIEERLGSIASGIRPGSSGSFGKPKPLIEAKQVAVTVFATLYQRRLFFQFLSGGAAGELPSHRPARPLS